MVEPGKSSVVSMVSDAVASVCLGDADSAAGRGQSSLVSMASVVAGGIGFAVPALKSRRCRFILEYSDCIRQDRAFGDYSSPSALYFFFTFRLFSTPSTGFQMSCESIACSSDSLFHNKPYQLTHHSPRIQMHPQHDNGPTRAEAP